MMPTAEALCASSGAAGGKIKADAFLSSGRGARHCRGTRGCHRPATPSTALPPLARQQAVGRERCQQPAAPRRNNFFNLTSRPRAANEEPGLRFLWQLVFLKMQNKVREGAGPAPCSARARRTVQALRGAGVVLAALRASTGMGTSSCTVGSSDCDCKWQFAARSSDSVSGASWVPYKLL